MGDLMKLKEAEIIKLKSNALSAEKAKKMYQDELMELRAHHEGAEDAELALNGVPAITEKTRKLEIENSKLREQMKKVQVGSALHGVVELEKKLEEKEAEVAKLVTDKEKLEAYTKKTLQKFQEKYLVALQDCKAKLKEKHDKIEALESRSASEKVAQKREEKLLSSAIFELGMGIMSNRLGKRRNDSALSTMFTFYYGHQ